MAKKKGKGQSGQGSGKAYGWRANKTWSDFPDPGENARAMELFGITDDTPRTPADKPSDDKYKYYINQPNQATGKPPMEFPNLGGQGMVEERRPQSNTGAVAPVYTRMVDSLPPAPIVIDSSLGYYPPPVFTPAPTQYVPQMKIPSDTSSVRFYDGLPPGEQNNIMLNNPGFQLYYLNEKMKERQRLRYGR